MNSSEIFPTYGSNSSDHNTTEGETAFKMTFFADIMTFLLGFPINSYVIWLIVTGTGNGLAAEFFSLNLSICEMVICVESVVSLFMYDYQILRTVVDFLDGLTLTGRCLFQSLICVERYLAVVQPVTFLKFKPLRYRLICCIFVWAAGFVFGGINLMALFIFQNGSYYILTLVYLFFFSIQLFCLVTVLRALKQSGPGDRRRERNENHMKRRAFYLILITTVTMVCFFLFPLMILFTFPGSINNLGSVCVIYVCLALAGSVQPLLFLYRLEKPPFVKCQ